MIHYTSGQLSGFPWIASADTLKIEDLLPKFWSVAEDLAARSGRLDLLAADLLQTLTRLAGEDSNYEAWSEDEASAALSELVDVLEHAAPCGFGFGASEGDGACFGFWLSEDWAEALETLGLDDDDPTEWAALIAELDADGIDPDTLDDAYQGRAEGYSEERAGADYAQQLAEDTGDINWKTLQWPLTCIDWDAAWRELQMGDGYRLHDLGGGDWLVFRAV
jgi:hypothetical protein